MREPETLISMISGFWDVSLSPKTNMIHLWKHQDTLKSLRNPKAPLKKIIAGSLIFGDCHFV